MFSWYVRLLCCRYLVMLESLSTKPTNFAGLTKMPAELFTHFYFYFNNVHLYWPTAKTKELV